MADYNYDTQWLLILSGILITVTVVQSFICRRLRNEHPNSGKFAGCKRAKSSYQRVRLLFGLDFLVENIWNTANGKFSQGFRERFQEYGKTHTSHILHKRIINTIEPENLEAIMKTHFEDYTILPGRKKLICTLFGEGVLATTGSDWGYSRMLVRRSVGNLNYQTCLFERSVTYLLNQILSKHQDTFDFAKFASRYTLDVAIRLILGDSDEAPKEQATKSIHQFASDFIHLGEMAKVFTVLISRIPYLADIMHWNDLKPTQKRVYWFVDGFVSRALCTRTNKESSHTDQLLEIKSSTKGDTLLEGFAKNSTDAVRIRSEILNLLLASHDSVGAALSELFYFLARKPEVWSKIRAEVEDMFQGRSPSLDGLKQMTYLRYVINEALRIRPTLSVHARQAIRDTVLSRGGGFDGKDPLFVRKGTYVVYSNYALHHNPEVFEEDVDEFRPERWMNITPSRFEYLSFGAGPRVCPGEKIGWTMLSYAIVRLAQEFREIQPRDDRPWKEAEAFNFQNRNGVHIAMIPA